MAFSSTIFLFIFLPFVLIVNFLLRKDIRNIFLLLTSLFFYAWGEGLLVLVMLTSISLNYISGIGISYFRDNDTIRKLIFINAILANLLLLFYYKYFGFVLENLKPLGLFLNVEATTILLPIGISFFTFEGISYLADLYKKEISVEKKPVDLGLYIAFFPHLIAGPIIRYQDITNQIKSRVEDVALFTEGIIRFIRGLSKKLIIANTAALIADMTFDSKVESIPTLVSWIGLLCYTLQIYFDFSGYSDMAIGLGKMFGFDFKENFNHPYISTSVQDFWRRWHISLSSWFRDYIYIPLGGNKKSTFRTYVNLIIVFFITGLWHGASWNFIIWGLFHGFFLILERSKILNLEKFPIVIRHIYLLLVVMVGWVFFRTETLMDAGLYLKVMCGFSSGNNYLPLVFITNYSIFVIFLGLLFSTPIRTMLEKVIQEKLPNNKNILVLVNYTAHLCLFIFSIMELAQTNYNPFIYFRF